MHPTGERLLGRPCGGHQQGPHVVLGNAARAELARRQHPGGLPTRRVPTRSFRFRSGDRQREGAGANQQATCACGSTGSGTGAGGTAGGPGRCSSAATALMIIGADRFEELVADALDLIPPQLAAAMDNVVVLVEPRNPDDPGLLGLYEGVDLTRRDSQYSGSLPDRITIYRDALLDICRDEQELVHEVVVTVVHEVAHHFGIPDHRLHELGWS